MKFEFHLTKQQKLACGLYDKGDFEITIKAATGFGKTVVLTKNLEKETRSIVVFPSINLINQYIGNNKQNKYMPHLSHRKNIFTYFTEKNEITNQMNLDYKGIKQVQKNLETQQDMLCITTYNSLPMVLKHLKQKINIHFDEAHHRRRETVKTSLDKYHDKIHRIINYSATPSDECQGEIFRYSLKQAIDDGVVRDFDIHYLIGTTNDKENMLKYIKHISNETGNRKCIVFTGLSEVESENKHNVNNLVRQWKRKNKDNSIWIEGIVGSEKSEDRMMKMKAFENHKGIALLVSCRTMKEGVDLKGANCVIFMDAVKSSEVIIQNIGRVLRPYRNDDGVILPNQPKATVLLNVFIDKEEYDQCVTDDEKDLYLRNTGETKNGSFGMILNVVSALREDDDEWEEFLLNYPSGLNFRDNTDFITDIDSDIDYDIDYDNELENNDNVSPLQKAGFEVGNVPADGNCFFHCAEKIIGVPHEDVRKSIKEYAYNHRDELRELGIENEDIDAIGYSGEWNNNIGDLVPRIFNEIYKIPIAIHNVDGTVRERYGEGADENVHHLLLENNHYSPLTIKNHKETKKNKIKQTGGALKRKFIGHIADEMKVLWSGEEGNTFDKFMMKLQYRIEGKIFNDINWDDRCNELIAFMEKVNGERRPSQHSKDRHENLLASWLNNQNQNYKFYKRGMKEPKRRNKWEEITNRFSILNKEKEDIWNDRCNELIAFMEKTNGMKFPSSVAKYEEEKKCGRWWSNQTQYYTHNIHCMKEPKRREVLEDIMEKFPILKKNRENVWIDNLIGVKRYIKKNKKIPSQIDKDPYIKMLGGWVQNQRKFYDDENLDDNRATQWEEMVNEFPNLFEKRPEWKKYLKNLREYIKTYGQIPTLKDGEKYKKLSLWTTRQKQIYKNKTMPTKYIEDWETLIMDYPNIFADFTEKKEEEWFKTFDEYKNFIITNKRKPLYNTEDNDSVESKLGSWGSRQHKKYNTDNTLNKKQCQFWKNLIEDFPNFFVGSEDKWKETYNILRIFIVNHKRLPSSFIEEEKSLQRFMSKQNHDFKHNQNKMKEKKYRDLWITLKKKFPLEFDTNFNIWITKFIEYDQFLTKEAYTPNKRSHNKLEKGLGNWGSTQKQNYKSYKHGMKDPKRRKKWEELVEKYPKAFGDYVNEMRQIRDNVARNTDHNDITERSVESSSDTESVSTISMGSIDKDTHVSANGSEDKLEDLSKEYLLVLYRNLKHKQQINSRAYTAPNPKSKEDINKLLKHHKPIKGIMVVLDHTDFNTCSLLNDPTRTVVPQRDLDSFNKMKQHEKFGKCVIHKDLLDYLKELPKNKKISMVYADLMGSIKEAIPILDELKDRVCKGSIVAITISCRDGEPSIYTNSFATKLVIEMNKRFPKHFVITPDDLPIVYGEHVRMATLIIRLQ